jgi:ATP dependent DNA ligase-like protein
MTFKGPRRERQGPGFRLTGAFLCQSPLPIYPASCCRVRVACPLALSPVLANQGPSPALRGLWLHEIKHEGFRVIARKDGPRVRLYSRPGNDLTRQFPLIVEALARLRSCSCIIDGEAVACDDNGIASFELIRQHRVDAGVFLYAFDLLELNGDDLRRDPLRSARRRSHPWWLRPSPASGSTSTWKATVRPSSVTPASSGSRASCPSARTRLTAQGARPTGSR